MTPDEVRRAVEPILHAALGPAGVEKIVVQEDGDWGDEASFSVDVFLAATRLPVGADTYLDIRRSLSEALSAEGERRFAYLRLRDRRGEAEEDLAPGPA